MKTPTMAAITLALGCMILGCSKEAQDQYKSAGEDASKAAQKTGQAMATDAEKAKIEADNALEVTKVKSALASASGLEAKDISVECDTPSKTITLKGTVPDAAQKEQAETVTKGIAGSEFTVLSKLEVVSK